MSKSFRFAILGAGILLFASCKNMQVKEEYFTVDPNPLEVKGGEVNYTVTGTFPSKTFVKKVVAVATPELRWEGGSVKGEPVTLQGEKVQGNGKVIEWKEGGSFTYNGNFKYQPEMAKSELYVTFEATKKGKPIEIEPVKIADGVLSTAELYAETAKGANTAGSKDAFQRIIKDHQDADIMFVIQQANVRSSETGKTEVKDLVKALKDYTVVLDNVSTTYDGDTSALSSLMNSMIVDMIVHPETDVDAAYEEMISKYMSMGGAEYIEWYNAQMNK